MTEVQTTYAMHGAEQLGLITQRSVTVNGIVEWEINIGVEPPMEQLHLRHSLTSQVRQLQGISDQQQLLLEACLRVGYDWITGEIVASQAVAAPRAPPVVNVEAPAGDEETEPQEHPSPRRTGAAERFPWTMEAHPAGRGGYT